VLMSSHVQFVGMIVSDLSLVLKAISLLKCFRFIVVSYLFIV